MVKVKFTLDRRTDGQTDRQTDRVIPIYPPQTSFAGGITRHQNGTKKQEAQRATYRAPEYNVPPFWRIGQGGHLVFLIGPKNTNLVEDVEILLPVKFR